MIAASEALFNCRKYSINRPKKPIKCNKESIKGILIELFYIFDPASCPKFDAPVL